MTLWLCGCVAGIAEQGFALVKPVLSQATIDALTISSSDCREELLSLMTEEELETSARACI
jgi:hypothetical protein